MNVKVLATVIAFVAMGWTAASAQIHTGAVANRK